MGLIIRGGGRLSGDIRVPGDKSISHRGVILGALANGTTVIENILMAEDTRRTIKCFQDMGVEMEMDGDSLRIEGVGLHGLHESKDELYCGNSGTTMRLLSGVMVGQKFSTILTGDDSLDKRPMDRIIIPLTMMGGSIKGVDNRYPPLHIEPSKGGLEAISYSLPMASAQVKSSILLAGLYGNGITRIEEPKVTRDHTEMMLKYFGADIYSEDGFICMEPNGLLSGGYIHVPGDISSAAYLMVAGSMIKDSHIIIRDVGVNPTRTGIINILKDMGADIRINNRRIANLEPIADIEVKYSSLKGIEMGGEMVATMIDEIPILAVAAAFASGRTVIRDVEELRYKECDRIRAIHDGLSNMGADIEELPDGLIIEGGATLKPAALDSHGDHRIAMALSIAALGAEGESRINGHRAVDISYPDFYKTLWKLSQ
ncbi:MAG: 3-phosphoshikimate 1-carboxyvinyltransferase [Tissierellia bacterium]|nr:3-phosphoshikimate 1-carboxyvinyltransferase [Tissierellia bacterium]